MELPFPTDWTPRLATLPTFSGVLPPPPSPSPAMPPPPILPVAQAPQVPASQPWRPTGDAPAPQQPPEPTPEILQVAESRKALSAVEREQMPFAMLAAENLLSAMSPAEKLLRTTFVEQYLYDYDEFNAAVRIGYSGVPDPVTGTSPARHAGSMLLLEPAVQRLIREYTSMTSIEFKKEQVIAHAFREACNHVTGNGASRIAAMKLIATIEGFITEVSDNRKKKLDTRKEIEEAVKGGVLVLPPVISNHAEWEAGAADSQRKLKEAIRAE